MAAEAQVNGVEPFALAGRQIELLQHKLIHHTRVSAVWREKSRAWVPASWRELALVFGLAHGDDYSRRAGIGSSAKDAAPASPCISDLLEGLIPKRVCVPVFVEDTQLTNGLSLGVPELPAGAKSALELSSQGFDGSAAARCAAAFHRW